MKMKQDSSSNLLNAFFFFFNKLDLTRSTNYVCQEKNENKVKKPYLNTQKLV